VKVNTTVSKANLKPSKKRKRKQVKYTINSYTADVAVRSTKIRSG
jgi:hypothetical protein